MATIKTHAVTALRNHLPAQIKTEELLYNLGLVKLFCLSFPFVIFLILPQQISFS